MSLRFRTSKTVVPGKTPRLSFILRKAVGKVWIDHVRLEEVNAAMHVKPLETVGLQGNPTWKCGLCMLNCPAGGWKEKYSDTGLSKFGK